MVNVQIVLKNRPHCPTKPYASSIGTIICTYPGAKRVQNSWTLHKYSRSSYLYFSCEYGLMSQQLLFKVYRYTYEYIVSQYLVWSFSLIKKTMWNNTVRLQRSQTRRRKCHFKRNIVKLTQDAVKWNNVVCFFVNVIRQSSHFAYLYIYIV